MQFLFYQDQPPLNYINDDFSNPEIFENISLCEDACKSDAKCVQFIYFNKDYNLTETSIIGEKSCFLRYTIDYANGVNVMPQAEAWTIKSQFFYSIFTNHFIQKYSQLSGDTREFKFDELLIGGSYLFEVESTSNLGFTLTKDKIKYNISESIALIVCAVIIIPLMF